MSDSEKSDWERFIGYLRRRDKNGVGLVVGGCLFIAASFLFAESYHGIFDRVLDKDVCLKKHRSGLCAGGRNLSIPLKYLLLIGCSSIALGVYINRVPEKGRGSEGSD